MVMVTALIVMSTGSMVVFTVTGSVDTMSSEAAETLNNTMTTYSIGLPALIIVCTIGIIVMLMFARNAF